MATEKRRFLLIELLLAAVLSFLLLGLVLDRRQKPQKVIGVVIHQSSEASWRGFLSGARAAAEDESVVLSVAENVNLMKASDFDKTVQDTLSSGAAALIAKPVTGGAALELMQALSGRMPVILAGVSDASVCSVTPDNYAMGHSVGEEIRADYESGLSGKTLGILLPEESAGDAQQALSGLQDALDGSGVKILYKVKNSLTDTGGADVIQRQQWVDIVAALDDNNLGIAGELSLFGVEDFATAFRHLALALSARALTTAGRGEVYALVGKSGEECAALGNDELLVVDFYCNVSAGHEVALGNQQDDHQHENDGEENADAC